MKVVQTQISEAEYSLLKKKAEAEGKTIKEALREAVEAYVAMGRVDPDDPLFSGSVARKGAKDGSVRHDKYIYGGD